MKPVFFALTLLVNAIAGSQSSGYVPDARMVEAQQLIVQSQFAQARDLYEQILLADAGNSAAVDGMAAVSERLALNQRAQGHMDAALAELLRAQKVTPFNKNVLYDLGVLEEEMRLYLDSEATLEELVSMSPPIDLHAHYALARTDLDLGKLEAAQQQMQIYLDAFPQDASAHYGLGCIYLRGLQFDKADAELHRSIALQPKQSEAYYQLGLVDLDRNRFDEAIQSFEKSLERDPNHGGALAGIGMAYYKLKRYAEAQPWLLSATHAAPNYQLGHYYLGLTLARLNQYEASRQELMIATDLALEDNQREASRLRLNNGETP